MTDKELKVNELMVEICKDLLNDERIHSVDFGGLSSIKSTIEYKLKNTHETGQGKPVKISNDNPYGIAGITTVEEPISLLVEEPKPVEEEPKPVEEDDKEVKEFKASVFEKVKQLKNSQGMDAVRDVYYKATGERKRPWSSLSSDEIGKINNV